MSVLFQEFSGSEVHEGQLVGTYRTSDLTAKDILTKLISSEEEIRHFCQTNHIGSSTDIFVRWVQTEILDHKEQNGRKIQENHVP